jgi:hypothetical protein
MHPLCLTSTPPQSLEQLDHVTHGNQCPSTVDKRQVCHAKRVHIVITITSEITSDDDDDYDVDKDNKSNDEDPNEDDDEDDEDATHYYKSLWIRASAKK